MQNDSPSYRIKIESLFSLSFGVFELWRKNAKGAEEKVSGRQHLIATSFMAENYPNLCKRVT